VLAQLISITLLSGFLAAAYELVKVLICCVLLSSSARDILFGFAKYVNP